MVLGFPCVTLLKWILVTPVQFVIGARFYKGSYKSLRRGSANMDVLVAMGTSASYLYSVGSTRGEGGGTMGVSFPLIPSLPPPLNRNIHTSCSLQGYVFFCQRLPPTPLPFPFSFTLACNCSQSRLPSPPPLGCVRTASPPEQSSHDRALRPDRLLRDQRHDHHPHPPGEVP